MNNYGMLERQLRIWAERYLPPQNIDIGQPEKFIEIPDPVEVPDEPVFDPEPERVREPAREPAAPVPA